MVKRICWALAVALTATAARSFPFSARERARPAPPDPFIEMERRMEELRRRFFFGRDPFEERDEVGEEVRHGADSVTLALRIPDLDAKSVKLSVERGHVRLSYEASADGWIRRYERVLPVPEGADPERHRLVKDGDELRVVFERSRETRA